MGPRDFAERVEAGERSTAGVRRHPAHLFG
jgi:hypothetical protein